MYFFFFSVKVENCNTKQGDIMSHTDFKKQHLSDIADTSST